MERRQNGYLDVDDNTPFLSEYNKRFPVYDIEPSYNYKPSTQSVRVEEPMEVNTSNKLDYPEWNLPERRPRERASWNPPADPFGGESTARGDYKGTYLPKQKSYKPDAKPFQSQDPLDGHTTTGVDYPAYDIKPRPRRQTQPYQKPDGRMEGDTLNRLNFPHHNIQPRQSYKPPPNVASSGEPLDTTTTASLDYKPYKIEPKQPRERQKWVKPDGRMDGVTTSKSEYKAHDLQPRENYKPAPSIQKSEVPFKGDTTNKLDFPSYPIEPRRKRQAPQYTKPDGRMEDETSNRRDYPHHELSTTRSYKPEPVVQPSEPFDGETTARKEYKQHEIEPRKRREPAKYTKPEGKMDGISTSRSEFPKHHITPRKLYRPDNTVQKSDDPFSNDTTTGLSYPEYKTEPRQSRKAQPYVKPDGKMDGISTNAAEFPRHELPVKENFKPPSNVVKSTEKFEGQTSARLDYPSHPIEPRQRRQQVQYTKPEGVFDGTTSNRKDYQQHVLTPREPFKPENSVQRSTEPFDHKTSASTDYPAHEIEPRKRREQQKYVKPEGTIDGVTTNRAEYPQHEIKPTPPFKPTDSYIKPDDRFNGDTIARLAYQEYPIEPRKMRPVQQYVPPEGKMEGDTSNRLDYQTHQLQPKVNYKPVNEVQSGGKFDGKTTTEQDFPAYEIEPRQRRQQVQYTKPEGVFDGTTSNRKDYQQHVLTPREPFKPENSVHRSTEPFDHKTSASTDYPAHEIEPMKRREQQKYVKPEGTIDCVTTNRAEYPQHEIKPTPPFKPTDSYIKPDDRFNGDTIARLAYQEYPIEPRKMRPVQQYVPPEGKMEGDTTNRLDYQTHQLQPKVNYKPVNEVQSGGKFDGKTTTEQDFPAYEIEPRQRRQQIQYTKPEGVFDGTTSNRKDYQQHVLTPRETFKPENSVQQSTEPFDHKTSASTDYPAHEIEPRKRREQQKYVKPEGTIDCVTTNRAEYPQHEIKPTPPFKPTDSYIKPDDRFNGDTTFRSNYPEHPIEARTTKEQEHYTKPTGSMEGDTTNRLDYREYEIMPRQSFKPVDSVENSKEPFNGDTTTRLEYPAYDIEPRKLIDRHQYVKPVGDMEKVTSNQLDYPQHNLTPCETFKPKDSVQQSDVPFEGDTTSRRDFKVHDITPRQMKEQAKYVKPEGKFADDTTNRAEYPTHKLKPAQSFRPSNEPMLSQDPFDGSTTSRRDYGEHKIEPKEAVQPDVYKKPEGEIDFTTINKLNFVESVPRREMLKRPESSHIMDRGGHFEGNTRYGEDFKGHEITPRQVLNKNENYHPPTVPMETTSSARLDYQQHELPKQEAVRPKDVYSAPKVKFDGRTTNTDSYKGDFVPKTQSFKPSGEPFQSGVPFDDTTTSKSDFHQHEVEPRKVITGIPYEKPVGLMDLNTTNQEAFTAKISPREKVKRPESSHLMNRNSKFEGSSNYGSDFVPHDVQPRELVTKSKGYNPPEISMETSTLNQLTFTQHPIEKTHNFKPAVVVEKPAPFEGKTGYTDTFVGHQIPQKEIRTKPAYEAPKIKFEGSTTASDSFKGVFAPKQESYRPSNAPLNSGVPLDDRTTAKQDFKEHKVERRQLIEKAQYAKPDGGFDFNTTNKVSFTPKKTSRNTVTKPGSSGVMGRGGQFEGSTNYGSDFQSHEVTPRTLVKKSNDYAPPAIPMVTETTNKKDFTKPVMEPRKTYKPVPVPQMSKEPFAGSTGYKDTFKEFEVPRRSVKTKDEYNPPKVPFNGTTTNRRDYTGTTASKREAFKPSENTFKSQATFESSTTSKRDYGSHPVERREVVQRAQWVKPEGRMELQTTNNENFKQPTNVGRNSAPRPKSSGILKFGGKIEGITNYSSDFMQRDGGGRPDPRAKGTYVPNPYPFQGTTTNRTDFTQRDGVKATSFKPIASPFLSKARFDNSTTYSADFTKSAPPWIANIPDPIAVGGPV